MRSRTILTALLTLVACSVFAAPQGELQQAVKRMKQRVEELAAYKQEKIIGENRQGFADIVNPPEKRDKREKVKELVEAENRDRRLVYKAIAARTDATAEGVGRQRAAQIYRQAKPGVLLEVKKDTWRPKKQRDATPTD